MLLKVRLVMEMHFRTEYRWTGESRGMIELGAGRQDLEVAPPPEFKGPKGLWSPEDLFVSSIETCFFLTLMFHLKQNKVKLFEYSSKADGRLERVDGKMWFSQVDLYPVLVSDADRTKAEEILEKAEQDCLVARSIKTRIVLHPQVEQRICVGE